MIPRPCAGPTGRRVPPWRLLPALLAVGCASPSTPTAGAACRVDATHEVGATVGPRLSGVALVPLADGDRLALWSDAVALHGRPLAPGGAPRGPARRLAAPCTGGLAVGADGNAGGWLACLEAGTPAKDRAAWVRVARLHGDGRLEPIAAREAGTAHEVSIGPGADGAPRVGWARVGAQAVWAPLEGAATQPLPRPGAFPRAPVFAGGAGRFWTERRVDGARTTGALLGDRTRGAAEPLGDAAGAPGGVSAVPDPAGGVTLAWRHQPDRWAVPWLWARRFDGSLRPTGDGPVRIARSGRGGPVHLRRCLGGLVAITPHRDGSVSSSLALRRLREGDLAPLAPELALFEQGVDWIESDARCSADGGRLDLLLGERSRTGRGPPRVMATSYRCGGR